MSTPQRRRLGPLRIGAAALLTAGGIALGASAIIGHQPPPQPPASAATPLAAAPSASPTAPAPSGIPAPSASPAPDPEPAALPRSEPTRLMLPTIDVDTPLMRLGLNDDGTIEVPPFDKDAPAGWYTGSPTPGEVGPSVILGHVDTYKAGPVVFYRLGDLRPGDPITVDRKDGSTAHFVVDRVKSVPKDDFPTLEVYGNTPDAQLRLITCGGDWDPDAHDYADNIVVFATYVDPAG